jgi:hypothetical protein
MMPLIEPRDEPLIEPCHAARAFLFPSPRLRLFFLSHPSLSFKSAGCQTAGESEAGGRQKKRGDRLSDTIRDCVRQPGGLNRANPRSGSGECHVRQKI